MTKRKWGLGLSVAAAIAGIALAAHAAGVYTPGMPAAPLPLVGTYQLGLDTELANGATPQSAYATLAQIAGFGQQAAGSGGWRNALVGGDFGTNLWQRGTAVSGFGSLTNTATYTADRWATFGGASSAINVSKQTGASDIPVGYTASLRFGRGTVNANTAQICIAQVVTTANSTRFQGQLAEFSFHALEGGTYSAANGLVQAYIVTGTGSDEGVASLYAGTWTGQASSNTPISINTTWNRYSMAAVIPAAATEVAVKLCETPVGAASANDWFEIAGVQLAVNPAAVAVTSSTGAASAGLISSNERRPSSIENLLQYAYYWRVTEGAAGPRRGMGQVYATATAHAFLTLPTVMRVAPTASITAGFAVTLSAGTADACTGLALTASSATTYGVDLTCTVGTTLVTPGLATQFIDNGGGGIMELTSEE